MNDPADLRSALIRVAMEQLQANADDISLRGVARAAGVSAMAPYRHFADKAALLGAVVERGFEGLRAAVAMADRRADGIAAIVEQGAAYISFAQTNPALFRLMFAAHKASWTPNADDLSAFAVLANRVRQVTPHQPEVASLGCWSLVHGLATLQLDGKMQLDDATMRTVLDRMVRGIDRATA